MTTVLAIHIAPALVHAAVDRDNRIDLVALGDSTPGMPVAVQMAGDGSIQVGGLVSEIDGPVADDLAGEELLDQLADLGTARIGKRDLSADRVLAHLLAHAYGRCVRVLDGVPDEVIIVRSSGGPDESVYAAAAHRAHIGEVTLIDDTRAWAALAAWGPRGIHPDLAGALGAVFHKRHGDPPTGPLPIVTREDLGESEREPMRPPLGPSVISVGTRSVFDETITAVSSQRRRPTMVVFAVVLALVVGGAVVMLLRDRSQSTLPSAELAFATTVVPTTTTVVPTTTTVVPTTTTVVPTTTTVVPTTTTVVPTTTTVVPTTTTVVPTTTTAVPTTTTLPPLGSVTLAENGLLLRAATQTQVLIGFGSHPNTVIETLVGLLGDLTSDTGWVVEEACDSPSVRRVWFGDLEVVFADDELADSTGVPARFVQWFVEGVGAPESTLWTLNRIGIGSTVMDLTDTHSDELTIEHAYPDSNDPAGYFRIDPFQLGDLIEGVTGNTTSAGRVLQLWAGAGCLRLFVG